MANLSSVYVKLSFKDKDGEEISIDLDNSSKYGKFVEAFAGFSYQGGGSYNNGNAFLLNGRWQFTGNFKWEDEINSFTSELLKVEPTVAEIVMNVLEYEVGMAWLSHYFINFDMETKTYTDTEIESYDFEDWAKVCGVEAPKREDYQTEYDYDDAYHEFMFNTYEEFLDPMRFDL